MSRTASVETVNREERSCVHPTPKMIDPKFYEDRTFTLVWRNGIMDAAGGLPR